MTRQGIDLKTQFSPWLRFCIGMGILFLALTPLLCAITPLLSAIRWW
ncbi:hypothetical protein [Pseudogulbenkiania sp. NH8B]|nr:hypothetical protein [Pseudogulbenkiania sp. NH8B]